MRMRAAAAAATIGAALFVGFDAPTTTAVVDAAGSSSEVAPIVVLLDVSDSMNEDDGAGTVKLQGAKTAVRQIVGALSDSTVFGVWSFPTSGCDGGGYVSAPAPLTDRTAVIGSIDRMHADHSTPTGVALRSLADDLTTRGYAGATIVLVSDGESTCGPPPCDVANQLVDEGFDVTVPTIGFRTSPSGAEELACVAAATGARSYAVDDSDELATQLQDLVRAQLELSVRYDASPMPGGSTRITATVTHTAGEPAHDVRLTLGLSDDAGQRAAVPPMMRIGNIPVGESVERTWTVGTGARDSSVTTAFTVSAWASNATRVVFDGRYTTAPTQYQKDELGDLFASVSERHPLVVFGDSYSSGEGVGGDYSIAPAGIDPSCHRSVGTYLGTVFRDQQTLNVACSGAVTRDLGEKSDKANLSQIDQLERTGLAPAVGVMTFGGNDIGFAGIVAECINPLPGHGCGDAQYRDDKLRSVDAHAEALARAYRLAWSAINTPEMRAKRDGAYAPLVVLAYPLVTHEEFRGKCHQFGPDEVVTADRLGKKLNSVIAAAVERVKNEGYEVHFVADTALAVRPDHTLCEWSDEAYINGWIPAANGSYAASESVHPKASGYLAETDAIIGWSGTGQRFDPDVDDEIIRNTLAPSCAPVERDWPTIIDPQSTQELELVRCGSALVKGSGFLPGAPVTVTVRSTPTLLGTIVPDEAGRIEQNLVLPETVAPGRHEIVVTGLDADGGFVEYRLAAAVTEPAPPWLWTALGAAIVFVVAGGVLTTIGLVRRRRTRAAGSPV